MNLTLLATSIGNLTVAVVAVTQARRSPLALPVAAMALDLGTIFLATFLNHLAPAGPFAAIDAVSTSLAPALVFHVVLAFVGRTRSWRRLLVSSYVYYGGLAASSATAFANGAGRAWIDSPAWAAVFLLVWIPLLAVAVALLVTHMRRAVTEDERARARTMLAALAVGGSLASTELWNAARGTSLPALGAPGTLVAMLLVAFAALRLRLFGRTLTMGVLGYALAIGLAAVIGYVTALTALGSGIAGALLGASLVTVLVVVATREAVVSFHRHGERLERLAVMGRFAAQMAHDVKNPLAALAGAAELLDAHPPPDNAREFALLMREQIDRLRVIVDKYDRMGRVEPLRSTVDLGALVRRVLSLQKATLRIEFDLAPSLPSVELDPDLVAGALENVVQNAVEAMPDGGVLRVVTSLDAARRELVLAVEDEGPGVDPRWAERAFDDFVTTKTTGSGLGLAFVRRVAIAHGGDATLQPRPGPRGTRGARVEMRFPLPPAGGVP